jgi:hypothetical protein
MKKFILAVVCTSVLAGCATRPRMDYDDLNHFKIDCANKDAQLRFLQTQLSTPNERVAAMFNASSVTRFVSAEDEQIYQNNKHIKNRSTDAIVRSIIWDLRTYCK